MPELGARGRNSQDAGATAATDAASPSAAATTPPAGREPKKTKSELGIEINITHRQYALTYGMMLGIRVAVGNQVSIGQGGAGNRKMTMDDFMKVSKMVFPPGGYTGVDQYHTPPHRLQKPFKFTCLLFCQ